MRKSGPFYGVLSLLFFVVGCAHCTGIKSSCSISSKSSLKALSAVSKAKIKAAKDSDYQPLANDTDSDGLTDEKEVALGTDPYWPDTDRDRLPDGYEVQHGKNPLQADQEALERFQSRIAKTKNSEDPGADLLVNTASCTMTRFNATTCTATCTGTCLFGTVSCYWSWDPIQWGIDKVAGGPCPGWMCHCP